ncbi:hypothetical protein [Tritonibacter mobilis]|uniref:hypothetical protein n=1 Tax=Tritonibacter mobilis TaxID=379347 RepID=UPI000806CA48|nr:hypothetical protein [Tritonibacter mobilis]
MVFLNQSAALQSGNPDNGRQLNLGHTEFLVNGGGRGFSNVEDAIEKLENLSIVFTNRWQRNEFLAAGKASGEAMICFDHIIGELMRLRDSRKASIGYSDTNFAQALAMISGRSKPNASQADVADITASPGTGRLPTPAPIVDISLEKALNKIKHRDPTAMNFRFDADRHILVFCALNTNGSLESIVELDVLSFCEKCRGAASSI